MSDPGWTALFDEILVRHLPLCEDVPPADAVLADLGLASLSTVNLVMELEDRLDIAIPDEILVAETFATAGSLRAAVAELLSEQARSA